MDVEMTEVDKDEKKNGKTNGKREPNNGPLCESGGSSSTDEAAEKRVDALDKKEVGTAPSDINGDGDQLLERSSTSDGTEEAVDLTTRESTSSSTSTSPPLASKMQRIWREIRQHAAHSLVEPSDSDDTEAHALSDEDKEAISCVEDDKETYLRYMSWKIFSLPIPHALKLYLNFYRELDGH